MFDFEVIAPDDFYNLDEANKEKYVQYIVESIQKTKNQTVRKMYNIMKRNVKHYQNDFYIHDMYMIKKYPGHFLWMTRETGTDLIPLEDLNKSLLEWYNAVKYSNKNFYYFNGERLKKVTLEEMEQIVSKHKKVLD